MHKKRYYLSLGTHIPSSGFVSISTYYLLNSIKYASFFKFSFSSHE